LAEFCFHRGPNPLLAALGLTKHVRYVLEENLVILCLTDSVVRQWVSTCQISHSGQVKELRIEYGRTEC